MKINVGITILIQDPKTTQPFSNGIRQNVILLQELFSKCSNVNKSYMINTASAIDYKGTDWESYADNLITAKQAETMCDLIIVCHGSLSNEYCVYYKQLNKKIVELILGAELSILNEKVLFSKNPSGIFGKKENIDAVWISPHFFERDKFLHEAQCDCPIYKANYVWDSRFVDKYIQSSKDMEVTGIYKPNKLNKKRISTLEPNINLVKTCTIPIVTVELFNRKHPHLLDFFNIFCGKEIMKKTDMIDFVKQMTIHKDKKCFFEARYPVVWTLNKYTDILLCHQSQCELNYLYLDAAWLGYPVVHNSPMMKELGWYYTENDSEKAIEHLKYIAENFDTVEHLDNKYLNKSREFAKQYLPTNPDNIRGYEELIDKVFERDQVCSIEK